VAEKDLQKDVHMNFWALGVHNTITTFIQ